MPIYEYHCNQCFRRSTFLIINVKGPYIPKCKHCGSEDIEKLISRVRMLRSDEARMESLTDPSKLAGLDENDPASMVRWMKKMGKEMGEDFAGDDFDQMIDEAAHEVEREKEGDVSGQAGSEEFSVPED